MIPFPGESLGVDYAAVTGTEITQELRYRAGSLTLTSGDEWRAWVYPGGPLYLESDTEPVVVSWVVEFLSGTVTLAASMGIDPAWGDDTAAHPTSLGTHTVTGPATLVMATSVTAADVLTGDDAPMLVLEATSGSAVVQQVKLRVWPPGGAAGGWSDIHPGFAQGAGTAPNVYVQSPLDSGNTGVEVSTDAESAWDALIAVVAGPPSPTTTDTFATDFPSSVGGSSVTATILFLGGGEWQATVNPNIGSLAVLSGADWRDAYPIEGTLVEEVDYIRPPAEVQDDYAAWVQQVGDGYTEWLDATLDVYLGVPAAEPVSLGSVVVHTVATDSLTVTPISVDEVDIPGVTFDSSGTLHTFADASDVYSSQALDTGGRYIVVSVGHVIPAALPWPGWNPVTILGSIGTLNNSGVSTEATTRPVLPPYRTWDPTAVLVYPHQLIQRKDGLGFGSECVFDPGTRQSSGRVFGTY